MRIAIHNSGDFGKRWISYCLQHEIDYKLVNCYDTNIISQLTDCDILMWHHNHLKYQDQIFAKQLLFSLQQAGKKVFPDFNTGWHFDDKIGQKYLFEALGLPMVNTYLFYSKEEADMWINNMVFPKVFKLRAGAGSNNVLLVGDRKKAQKLINKAFGKGFKMYDPVSNLKERWRLYKMGKKPFSSIIKGIIRFVYPPEYARMSANEKGYIYFQDYFPHNDSDTRVVVISDKAFAIKRLVRENDFRASGSGFIIYEKNEIDERCVALAFKANESIKSQCIAFDFIFDQKNNPLIVEISYCFTPDGYDLCPGYWTKNMIWHERLFNPYGWMISNLIKSERNVYAYAD